MLVLVGCIRRIGLMMHVHSAVIVRFAHMHLRRRREDNRKFIFKAWRRTASECKGCPGREDAEQIGQGDQPAHLDPN